MECPQPVAPAPTTDDDLQRLREKLREEYEAGFDAPPPNPFEREER